jgi:hypothetical protein
MEKEGYRNLSRVIRDCTVPFTDAGIVEPYGAIVILCNSEGYPVLTIMLDLVGHGRVEAYKAPSVTMWKEG